MLVVVSIAIPECTDTTDTCTCTSQFGGILNLYSQISFKLIAIQPASWIIITSLKNKSDAGGLI